MPGSYIPYTQDLDPGNVGYRPDFGFLQQELGRSNQQYEQGLHEVESDYSNIVNQPVLGQLAADKRKQYVGQIQEGLKKVAPTDLSLPQNVAQAENLYAPFWKDENLLTNVSLAKYYQGENSKLDSWENSTDKDVKALYNDDARTYLQIKAQEVANAPLDKNAYNKLQKGPATLFYDMEADISKLYKDEGNKGIDNVGIYGASIVTSHNGVKSLDSFRNYALSKLGPKYDAQLKASAYVAMYKDKQKLLAYNPGATPQQVDEHFATSNIQALANGYLTNKESYNKIGDYWETRANALLGETKGGKTASPDQRDKIAFYQDQAKAHRTQAAHYENEYVKIGGTADGLDVNNQNYQNQLKGIASNPEQYIGDINKQRMADAWATGMAYMNTSEKIELNPVIAEYNRHSEEQAKLIIQQRQVDATNAGTIADLYKTTGMTTPGGIQDPRFNNPGNATDPRTEGWKASYPTTTGTGATATGNNFSPSLWKSEGIGVTDVTKLPVDFTQQQQEKLQHDITNDVYSTTGLANSLVLSGAIKPEELPDLKEWSDNAMIGVKPTEQQAALLKKVTQSMKDQGIDVGGIHGPQGMQNALISYTAKVGDNLLKTTVGDNLAQVHAQGAAIVRTAAQMQQKMVMYNQNQQTYNRAENDLLTTNPLYHKLAIADPGTNQVRQVTASDLSKVLPTLNLEAGNPDYHFYNNQPSVISKIYTKEDFAKDWLNGNVKVGNTTDNSGRASVEVGGKWYSVNNMSSEQLNSVLYGGAQGQIINPHSVVGRFGTPQEHADLKKQASIAINSQLGLKNGLVYPRYGIDPTDPHASVDLIRGVAGEAASASVAPIIYAEEAIPGNEIGDKETTIVRSILSNADQTKKYVSHIAHVNTPEGLPAYEITMSTDASNEKVTGWSHSRSKFILPVADLQNAPALASMPVGEQSFLYNDLYKVNKPVTAPDIMKSYGQDYSIRGIEPDAKGNATYAYIVMRHSIADVDHPGQFQKIDPQVYKIPLSGPAAKNSEEIVNYANTKAQEYIGATTEVLKQIQQKSASDNEYRASAADVKQYGK